jgi:hypothetical protein
MPRRLIRHEERPFSRCPRDTSIPTDREPERAQMSLNSIVTFASLAVGRSSMLGRR